MKWNARGSDIVHLEVGEPDFDTPACVKDAACRALEDGHTHYTHSLGLFELREAICEYYSSTYGVSVEPDQVIVTSGSSPAIFLVFSALLEKDEEVIISDPHYACYPNFIKFVQGQPVTIPVYEEDGFQYKPESIKEKLTAKTRGHFHKLPVESHRQSAVGKTDAGNCEPWRKTGRPCISSPMKSITGWCMKAKSIPFWNSPITRSY